MCFHTHCPTGPQGLSSPLIQQGECGWEQEICSQWVQQDAVTWGVLSGESRHSPSLAFGEQTLVLEKRHASLRKAEEDKLCLPLSTLVTSVWGGTVSYAPVSSPANTKWVLRN